MSLNALLGPVLSNVPQVQGDMQVEVLREIPTETLYLALKNADAQVVLWFFENAGPPQVQGLIDIDCWRGDHFVAERFEAYFKSISLLHPVKIAQYMRELDPEIIIRALLEYCDVVDVDLQNPPEVPEDQFMLTPDSKYALILKTDRPDLREMLYLWLNKLSAADIELMRRHLEACKWEQISDLEEFSYQVKKGRLEEMGFVDVHEAMALYAVGKASEVKKQILSNPLPPGAKSPSSQLNEDHIQISRDFLPSPIEKPLFSDGFFTEVFKSIEDPQFKSVTLQELLRIINMALSADDLVHSSLDKIAMGSFRARRYVDLGLNFLCDGRVAEGEKILRNTPIQSIHRLGWLVAQDIVHAGAALKSLVGSHFFGGVDDAFRLHLVGRHPELTREDFAELGISASTLFHPQSALTVGARMAELFHLAQFFQKDLGTSLELHSRPIKGNEESIYQRLITALFRQAGGGDFLSLPLTQKEWPSLTKNFKKKKLRDALDLVESRVPPEARELFHRRMDELLSAVELHMGRSDGIDFPDPRFFRALALEAKAKA